MRMKHTTLLTTLIFLLGVSTSASATLIVDITGVAGSNQTTWTFSGSATAGGSDGAFFEDDTNLGSGDAWQDIGEYTDLNDFENVNVAGTATITIGRETRNIDLAYIDDDSVAGNDDFGVGVSGSDNFNFAVGDLISWTGSLLVTDIDLNDLNNSGLPVTFTTNTYGSSGATLDLVINIGGGAVSVPEPASVVLLGLGLIGLGIARTKRRDSGLA